MSDVVGEATETCPHCGRVLTDGWHTWGDLRLYVTVLPWSREDIIDILGVELPPGQHYALVEQSANWATVSRVGWNR